MKVITGWCSSGSHEGRPATSPSGKVFPECRFAELCACDCHTVLRKMLDMADLPHPVYDPPSTVPDAARLADLGIIFKPSDASAPDAIEFDAKEFKATPTGRRAKGQLEYYVFEVCKLWSEADTSNGTVGLLTTSEIARQIDPDEPPSAGAVDAVLNRWVKARLALIAVKPIRFVGFMPGVTDMGLDRAKARATRNGGFV